MEWISVKDKLPKQCEDVLICTPSGSRMLAYIATDGTWRRGGCLIKVTHWMPLPEPPKKQELRFSFEAAGDGYVIYRRGKKLTPWYLVDSLNGDPFSLFAFLTGLDDG